MDSRFAREQVSEQTGDDDQEQQAGQELHDSGRPDSNLMKTELSGK